MPSVMYEYVFPQSPNPCYILYFYQNRCNMVTQSCFNFKLFHYLPGICYSECFSWAKYLLISFDHLSNEVLIVPFKIYINSPKVSGY